MLSEVLLLLVNSRLVFVLVLNARLLVIRRLVLLLLLLLLLLLVLHLVEQTLRFGVKRFVGDALEFLLGPPDSLPCAFRLGGCPAQLLFQALGVVLARPNDRRRVVDLRVQRAFLARRLLQVLARVPHESLSLRGARLDARALVCRDARLGAHVLGGGDAVPEDALHTRRLLRRHHHLALVLLPHFE